jgi:CBS domain-containing protein
MKEKKNALLQHKLVKKLMTTKVKVLPINTPLSVVMECFWTQGINHIPIVELSGNIVGMFSTTDALKLFHKEIYNRPIITRKEVDRIKIIDNLHSTELKSISDTASLTDAKAVMRNNEVNSLLVYRKEELVGILTSEDLKKDYPLETP